MEINSVESFNLEIFFLCMIFGFGIYMLVQLLKINKLLKTPWKDIHNFREIEKEATLKKDDDDDEESEKKPELSLSTKNI